MNTEVLIVKRGRGRPKKAVIDEVVLDLPKPKIGRPVIYEPEFNESNEPIKSSVLTFQRRGYLISMIKSLKKQLYGKDVNNTLLYPVKSDYFKKSNLEVMEIIKTMKLKILEKKTKHSSSQLNSNSKLKKSSKAKEDMRDFMMEVIREHKENERNKRQEDPVIEPAPVI
jgi:hypothetical protein